MLYFSFFNGYLRTFRFFKVFNETIAIYTSVSKLLDISSYSKLWRDDMSMGNYLSRFPYRLSFFKYLSWANKSMYGMRSLMCLYISQPYIKSSWSSSVRGAVATLFLSRSSTYLLMAMIVYTLCLYYIIHTLFIIITILYAYIIMYCPPLPLPLYSPVLCHLKSCQLFFVSFVFFSPLRNSVSWPIDPSMLNYQRDPHLSMGVFLCRLPCICVLDFSITICLSNLSQM